MSLLLQRVEQIVVLFAIAVAVLILTLGGPQLVRRIHRWQRQREEYSARRQAAQYIQKAHGILDLELVRTVQAQSPADITEAELYWAVYERIRDGEGRAPSIERTRALQWHCYNATTPARSGHAPKAS